MKLSFWDILAIIFTSAGLIVFLLVVIIFNNPGSILNPYPFPTLPPTIVVPTATPTQLQLPPTWTPTPYSGATQLPTSTPMPTNTPVVLTPGG